MGGHAAMPFTIVTNALNGSHMGTYLGLFNGTCSSFITLVTAEMLGAKYGIGWYINWQKEMMHMPTYMPD